MQAKLSIGVTQFLLLTALCDRKINPATKLIYLFLSLALLLIPSVSQIGFSYNPERYTFLQPNLKTCSEKCLGCRLALFASMFHLGSIFFCSTLSLLLTLCDLFKAAFTGWGKSRLPLGALLPFTDPLLTGSFSSAKEIAPFAVPIQHTPRPQCVSVCVCACVHDTLCCSSKYREWVAAFACRHAPFFLAL